MSVPIPNVPKLRRASTAETVAEIAGDMIMSGKLSPGSPLQEVALARAFGVSRNTVREALKLLEGDRLVRHQRHRGAVVSALSERDVTDLYRIRRLLEGAGSATGRPGAALDTLARSLDALAVACERRAMRDIVECDGHFHAAIVGLLDSDRLNAFFGTIIKEVRWALSILSVVDAEYAEPEPLLAEHRAIFDAITDGESAQAGELVRRHLDGNERRLKEILRGRERGSGKEAT